VTPVFGFIVVVVLQILMGRHFLKWLLRAFRMDFCLHGWRDAKFRRANFVTAKD
jgi:hypothetical protein